MSLAAGASCADLGLDAVVAAEEGGECEGSVAEDEDEMEW